MSHACDCAVLVGPPQLFTEDDITHARQMAVAFGKGLSLLSDAQFQVEMQWLSKIAVEKEVRTHDSRTRRMRDERYCR